MSRYSRRDFLKHSAAGGLAAAGLPLIGSRRGKQQVECTPLVAMQVPSRVLGANDAIRVAVVGINQRGGVHIQQIAKLAKDKNVEIAYLVDPDSRLFAEKSAMVEKLIGKKPDCVQDLRKALEDPNLDAVAIASTNHWHAIQAVWACQAGKDVYVEKPCGHTVAEGRKIVEAARKYNRIVQHGTQSRSDLVRIAEIEAVRGGKYGKLLVAYAYGGKPRKGIGFKENKEPPKELDFNLWLGAAPEQPYHENLVHYNWHWFWDFGNGEIGNQGPHHFDIARWSMPDGAAPKSVLSLGGRFVWDDQGQTANTQLTGYDFGGPLLISENYDLVKKPGNSRNEFYTTEGLIRDGKFFPKGKTEGEPLPEATKSGDYLNRHFANFFDCVRSRKREELRAEILEGHLSVLLAHLGNISYKLGAETSFSQTPKDFADHEKTLEAFEGMKKHLADEAGMKLDGATYRLGRKLAFDAETEKFVGDAEADRMLDKSYRKPFAMPERV